MQAQRLVRIQFDLNCTLRRVLLDRCSQESGKADYDGRKGNAYLYWTPLRVADHDYERNYCCQAVTLRTLRMNGLATLFCPSLLR